VNIYFAVILAYLVVLFVVGFRQSRGVASQEDFSVAGRQLSVFVLFGTMLATWIGTGSIFGNAEKTYRIGIAAIIIPMASILGIAALSFLAGRVRGMRQITIQDLLEQRYNSTARVFGVVTMVIAYVTIVSYQYRAAGAVLELVWPGAISLRSAIVIATAFIILYTASAGMKSIATIGLVQGITMIIGITVTLPLLWYKAGGLEGMHLQLEPSHFDVFGPLSPLESLNLLLPPFLLILGDANMYQRFNSARSAGIARKAVLWTIGGIAFMECTIIVTAWVASSLSRDLANDAHVIAYAAREHLPVAIGALMLTTIMAIILSTAGSYLLAPASCLIRDIYQRFISPQASERSLVVFLRLTTVVLGIVAYGLSTLSDEFLSVAFYAYTIYGAGITPALLACFFWKRATGAGAVASITFGTATTLLWKYWLKESLDSSLDAVIPALGMSLLALIAVSLLTPPPPKDKVDAFFQPPQD
jgi:Na+/proline symporter